MPVQQHVIHEIDRRATLRGLAQLILLQVSELEKEENKKAARVRMLPANELYELNLRVEDSIIPDCEELGDTFDATITVSHVPQMPIRVSPDDESEDLVWTPSFSIWLSQSIPADHREPDFTLIRVVSNNQLMEKDGLRYPDWNKMIDHMSTHRMKGLGDLITQAAEFLVHGYHRTGTLKEQRSVAAKSHS